MKILIIEDLEWKANMLSMFIQLHLPNSKIMFCLSYAMALKHLGKKFDMAICDQNLGDGLGSDVLTMFVNNNVSKVNLLYSGEEQDYVIGEWKCHTDESVKTEILSVINEYTKNLAKKTEEQEMEKKGDVYNKENCDLKHNFLDKTLCEISKTMGDFKNDSKLTTRLVFGIFLTQFLAIGLKYFNVIK